MESYRRRQRPAPTTAPIPSTCNSTKTVAGSGTCGTPEFCGVGVVSLVNGPVMLGTRLMEVVSVSTY